MLEYTNTATSESLGAPPSLTAQTPRAKSLWLPPHAGPQNSVAMQRVETHQDCNHRGPHSDILVQADVVQWLAEDGPVVILVDEGDLHLGIAHVVRHTLVGKELGMQSRAQVSSHVLLEPSSP